MIRRYVYNFTELLKTTMSPTMLRSIYSVEREFLLLRAWLLHSILSVIRLALIIF